MQPDRQRIVEDPALAAALRAAYTGSGDAVDQLWWLERPGEPAPSGAPDPALRLRDLRERLYRADADPSAAREAAELDRRVRGDRAAVERAVVAVLASTTPAEAVPPPGADPAAGAAEEPEPSGEAGPAAQRARRVRPFVVVAAVAVLIGLVAGGAVGASVVAAQAARDRAVQPVSLAVFDRAFRSTDRPDSGVLPDFVRGAEIRRLQIYPSIGTTAYGARTTDGRICLVLVVADRDATAACAGAGAFAQGGVSAVVIAPADPVNLSGERPQDEIDLRWLPNGFITITPVPVSSTPSRSATPSA